MPFLDIFPFIELQSINAYQMSVCMYLYFDDNTDIQK